LIGASNLLVAVLMPVAIGLGVAHVVRSSGRARRERARRASLLADTDAAILPFTGLASVPDPLPIEQSGAT